MAEIKTPFIFSDWHWAPENKTLKCEYKVDQYVFTETFNFDFEISDNLSLEAFAEACTGLWLMAGISYFKAFHDRSIEIKNHSISAQQAEFFTTVYRYGLGEFCFENDLPLINPKFPHTDKAENTTAALSLKPEIIIPLGGGKDSLTTIELIKPTGIPFSTWTVGAYPGLQSSLNEFRQENSKHEHLVVKRSIDRQIIEINAQGAPNGHIPISAIWAFISVCTALLSEKKYIAFSNENSANEATTIYQGEAINHQYSKSIEFESAFRKYVHQNISPEVEYFSALRPLEELFIAQIFAQTAWEKHKYLFSSCNRNFHLDSKSQAFTWCGECPKCAFVFTILATFLTKAELVDVFGKNLFEQESLAPTFESLLGLTEHKPFECVGTINEVRKALEMAQKNFPEAQNILQDIKSDSDYDYQALANHLIPPKIWALLKPIITQYV